MSQRLPWIIVGVLVVLAAVSGTAWVYYGRMRAELAQVRAAEDRMRQQVERLEQLAETHAVDIERLRGDPAFIERTIRQRLNYVRPGEVVFRFRQE